MAARIIVDLSEGKILLFGGGPKDGEPDVGLSDGFTRASADEFKAALDSVGDLVKTLETSIEALPKRPEKIEIEFGVTLSQECDLWIVAPDASPEFRVKLVWGKGE
ncbi:MAG: CU044_2847 family protein [Methylocella sp.]